MYDNMDLGGDERTHISEVKAKFRIPFLNICQMRFYFRLSSICLFLLIGFDKQKG